MLSYITLDRWPCAPPNRRPTSIPSRTTQHPDHLLGSHGPMGRHPGTEVELDPFRDRLCRKTIDVGSHVDAIVAVQADCAPPPFPPSKYSVSPHPPRSPGRAAWERVRCGPSGEERPPYSGRPPPARQPPAGCDTRPSETSENPGGRAAARRSAKSSGGNVARRELAEFHGTADAHGPRQYHGQLSLGPQAGAQGQPPPGPADRAPKHLHRVEMTKVDAATTYREAEQIAQRTSGERLSRRRLRGRPACRRPVRSRARIRFRRGDLRPDPARARRRRHRSRSSPPSGSRRWSARSEHVATPTRGRPARPPTLRRHPTEEVQSRSRGVVAMTSGLDPAPAKAASQASSRALIGPRIEPRSAAPSLLHHDSDLVPPAGQRGLDVAPTDVVQCGPYLEGTQAAKQYLLPPGKRRLGRPWPPTGRG